ncbi:hypothetical protein [Okeania sp. SIO1I7]|uniref:hypothetical protein n=1 Tax=Okeania sp. SIO1I7 TaxID=2607772 RepID=UPI0013FA5867|nr:hypothetical protein [Okeania sp. SIO1I7]NET27393.1 hypothetical protein [Okeania sp. SIO1I7]
MPGVRKKSEGLSQEVEVRNMGKGGKILPTSLSTHLSLNRYQMGSINISIRVAPLEGFQVDRDLNAAINLKNYVYQ